MTTAEFIGTIIAGLGFTEKISAVNYDPVAKETFFETCLTHHVFKKLRITINGTDYTVTDFESNKWITVKGDATGGSPTEYTVNPPSYRHGTPIQAAGELGQVMSWKKKFPLWYLIEPFTEGRNDSPTKKVARMPRMKLLILFPIGVDRHLVEEQYVDYIHPAENALDDFRHALKTNPNVAKIPEYYEFTVRARVDFGVWVTKTDPKKKDQSRKSKEENVKLMLDEWTTGLEVDVKVPLKKEICKPGDFCQ
jgi:hypothetical protein